MAKARAAAAPNGTGLSHYGQMLGAAFIEHLQTDTPLSIGRDRFTKLDLAQMGILQLRAASILNAIASEEGWSSVADCYKRSSPYTFADYPAGVVTLYVLFRIFEARGYRLDEWYLAGREKALRTFTRLKIRELRAKAEEKRARRKAQRSAAPLTEGAEQT